MNRLRKFDPAFESLPKSIREARPGSALILGSGWSEAIPPTLRILDAVSYENIPGLGASRVAGHAGRLLLAEKHSETFLVFCGRRHWYEGGGWDPVILPVEMARRLGVRHLLVTNASGGLNPRRTPGHLMIVADHVNLSGVNPLQGEHVPAWGPRFPDLSRLYSPHLSDLLRVSMRSAGLDGPAGIYAFVPGPCYETPAEVAILRAAGADAVGMSTVPECLLGGAIGMNVGAVSFIANMAAGSGGGPLSHAEVLKRSQSSRGTFQKVLEGVLDRLARE